MGIAIGIIGAAIGVVGVAGTVAPGVIFRAIDGFKTSPSRVYGWAWARVLIGSLFVLGAGDTAYPTLMRVIGVVLILKALLVPLLGYNRVRSILDWFQARSPLLVRFLCLLVVLFGALLVWVVLRP